MPGAKQFVTGLCLLMPLTALAGGDNIDSSVPERMTLLFIQLGLIVVAAYGGGRLAVRLGLPVMLGEICTGVVLGAGVLGGISLPGFASGLFPVHTDFPISPELYAFGTLAALLLLFTVGLETDLKSLRRFSKDGAAVGLGGALLSFVLGDLIAVACLHLVLDQAHSVTDPAPLLFGAMFTATSVGVSARILTDKHMIGSAEGTTILAAAVMDDVIGIVVVAVVLGMGTNETVQWGGIAMTAVRAVGIGAVLTVALLCLARPLSRRLRRIGDHREIALISLAITFCVAAVFEKSGLAMIVGAYVTGLSLSRSELAKIIRDELRIFQRFFVPVFFCLMGMMVDVTAFLSPEVVVVGLGLAVAAIAGKVIGCGIPALYCGFNRRQALSIGLGMTPRGEVAMIIAALGLSSGIIEYTGFGLAVMMAIVTTLAVPPLLQRTLVSGGEQEEILEGSGKGVLTFDMPNKETLMLVLDRVVAQFESEGYYVQRLDVPHAVFRFQLDESTIILRVDHLHLLCSCQIREIPFVRMLFCEVAADLEAIRSHVQSVAYSAVCRNVDAPVADGTSHDRLPLSTAAVEVALSGTTKTEVIDELLQLLVVNGQLPESNVAAARRDVLERESNMSTGMHDGIALPHARTTAIPDVVCAIGIHRTGIDFKSVDGKPSHIFVLTLVPHGYTETYLHLLAEVSQFLSRATNREHVLECETNEQFRNLLRPPDSDE